MLRGLAIEFDFAVLLLAHPSIAGMASGSGSSGSTAWSNSVRSRLYLDRPKPDGDEKPDEDQRILTVKKANYAPTGGKIELRWKAGCFVRDDGEVSPEREAMRNACAGETDGIFLKLLSTMIKQGREVSPKSLSVSYAPSVFEKHPDSQGIRKKVFAAAMERLLNSGAIHIRTDGPPSKKRSRLALGTAPSVVADGSAQELPASNPLPTRN